MVTGVVSATRLTSRSTDVKRLCFSRCARPGPSPRSHVQPPARCPLGGQRGSYPFPLPNVFVFLQQRRKQSSCYASGFTGVTCSIHSVGTSSRLWRGLRCSPTAPCGSQLRRAARGRTCFCGCSPSPASASRRAVTAEFTFALSCSACVSTVVKEPQIH